MFTKEKSNTRMTFYQPWMEGNHIITCSRYPDKNQKLCKAIGISRSNTNKVLFIFEQIYARGVFEEKEITDYEIKLDNDKDWPNTLILC